jgi:hypothetical protein
MKRDRPVRLGKNGEAKMNSEISKREQRRHARQRAFSIRQFSEIYNIGRTKVYEEIKRGRLRGRKIGNAMRVQDVFHLLQILSSLRMTPKNGRGGSR